MSSDGLKQLVFCGANGDHFVGIDIRAARPPGSHHQRFATDSLQNNLERLLIDRQQQSPDQETD